MKESGKHPIRRVAIIGAGPVGIETAKYLIAEDFVSTLDIYEQQATVGGTWIRTPTNPAESPSAPQLNPFQPLPPPMWTDGASKRQPIFMTPMYDHLETNIPKELMSFSRLPFSDQYQLFPPWQEVLQYLDTHAADVKHLIRFHTQVFDLRLLPGDHDSWQLKSRDLVTKEEICIVYDAIAVCSGHYSVPFIPNYPGIGEWHRQGLIDHTRFFRSSDAFRDKKVLVVGNAASGMDIAFDIATVCQRPLLLSSRREGLFSVSPDFAEKAGIKSLPSISEFVALDRADKEVKFANGQTESGIDIVLFATGYLYNFPFLKTPELELIDDGGRVKNTYQHIFHIGHPSLAFAGLPMKVLPFPLSEAQAAVIARVWSGRIDLPNEHEMRHWEQQTILNNGDGRAFHTLNFPKDFEYQHELADWASEAPGRDPPRWDGRAFWARERFPTIKRAFASRGQSRHSIRTLEELGFDYGAWVNEQSLEPEAKSNLKRSR